MARLAGGLRGCFVYCSLSGGSLLLHPSSLPAPSRTIMCFLLAWMSRLGGLVGTNASMRRCCCSRRRGQASKCRCSPSFSAPCSSLWVAGVLGLDFRGTLRFIGGSGPPRSNSGWFRGRFRSGGSHRRCPSATQHVTSPAAVPIRGNADDGRGGKDEQPLLPYITGGTLCSSNGPLQNLRISRPDHVC